MKSPRDSQYAISMALNGNPKARLEKIAFQLLALWFLLSFDATNPPNNMKTLKQIALILAFFLALGACTKPAEPTAAFDIEKAKAAITEVNQKMMAAIATGDSSAFASMYHSQAIVMPANDEAVSGTEKIASGMSVLIRMSMLLKLTTSSVWGDADLVVEEGGYEMTDKGGAHIDHGKYIVLWKEENGQWKLYRDIWNSSMPMAPPPATKN